jgi:hypothetical protein
MKSKRASSSDGFAVEFFQIGIDDAGNHHASSTAAVEKEVFPLRMVGGHLFLNLRTCGWILEPLKKFIQAAIGDPGRKTGGKGGGTGDIGIHVRGNVLTCISGSLDLTDDFGHVAPAGFARNFQMENFNG